MGPLLGQIALFGHWHTAHTAVSTAHVKTRIKPAPNEIVELLPEFLVMLRATNRSASTIALYRRAVTFLDTFLLEQGMPRTVDAVAREHLEAFSRGCWTLVHSLIIKPDTEALDRQQLERGDGRKCPYCA